MKPKVVAVDLGAATGRVFLGKVEVGRVTIEPVARFPNTPLPMPDGLHWNVTALFGEMVAGLRRAAEQSPGLESVGLDSWGADYGLLRAGRLLGVPYHYRDARGERGAALTHEIVPPAELYRRNGLEQLPFNSLYQLAADRAEGVSILADTLLFTPDLLGYWLTGHPATEPTIASTSGLFDIGARKWDVELIERLGLPFSVMPRLIESGSEVGPVAGRVAEQIGAAGRLVLRKVASHDTASAVVGTPLESSGAAYLSCGTWALLGVERSAPVLTEKAWRQRFTNEAGLDGRVLLQKNLMGLGLVNDLAQEVPAADMERLLAAAEEEHLRPDQLIDPSDPAFLKPGQASRSIMQWFENRCIPAPQTRAALVRCVLESLAAAFAEAVATLEELTGEIIPAINIVGGGSRIALLCQATSDRVGKPVLAGPVEASVVGNILVQARAMGMIEGDLSELRAAVRRSFAIVRYEPR